MPEGDTLFRTAAVLREALLGRDVVAARGRVDGPALGRVVGSRVDSVEARGKHLLIGFGAGLTLHTHLRMHGSWHRYRTGEAWRRSATRAVAVIEVQGSVAVCFDAPTVELLDTRAVAIHPRLRALGPDLLAPAADVDDAMARLRAPERAAMPIGDALLDQTALAGLGNVYRSEVCFIERVDPFAAVSQLRDDVLRRLVDRGRALIIANRLSPTRTTTPDLLGGQPGAGVPHGRQRLYVYGRAGRPCLRCGSAIATRTGGPLARRTYWCPACQPTATPTPGAPGESGSPSAGVPAAASSTDPRRELPG